MSATFELQAAELRGLIERVFPAGKRRRSRMLAVGGAGYSGPLATAAGEFTVTTVSSELELRMILPTITDDTPNLLVLVPWDVLPLDLSGRFAGHGRVLRLSPDRRLQSLLALDGKVTIDADVWKGALATYLLRRGDSLEVSVGGGRLTKSGACSCKPTTTLGARSILNSPARCLRGSRPTGRSSSSCRSIGP